MNDYLRNLVESRMEPPPMPPEAFPPGLIGRSPAVHATMEVAWKSMGYQMFCNGATCSAILILTVILAVLCRGQILAFLRSFAANVPMH